MSKLSLVNLSSKAGARVDVANVEVLSLKSKQIGEIQLSFEPFARLRELDLSSNRFQFPRQIEPLFKAPSLRILALSGNPICRSDKQYRERIIAHLPLLERLDGEEVSADERAASWLAFPDCKPSDAEQKEAYQRQMTAKREEEEREKLAAVEAEKRSLLEAQQKRKEIAAHKQRIMEEERQRKEKEAADLKRKETLLRQARRREKSMNGDVLEEDEEQGEEEEEEEEEEETVIDDALKTKQSDAEKKEIQALLLSKKEESQLKSDLLGDGDDFLKPGLFATSSVKHKRNDLFSTDEEDDDIVAKMLALKSDSKASDNTKAEKSEKSDIVVKKDAVALETLKPAPKTLDDDLFSMIDSDKSSISSTKPDESSFADALTAMLSGSSDSGSKKKGLFD